jgi:hypothetical protein
MKLENDSQGVALGYLIVVPLALEDKFGSVSREPVVSLALIAWE